jgi:hypothetical protein
MAKTATQNTTRASRRTMSLRVLLICAPQRQDCGLALQSLARRGPQARNDLMR